MRATAEILRRLGASVEVRLYPGTKHRIYEETSTRARSLIEAVLKRRLGAGLEDTATQFVGVWQDNF